MGKFSIIANSLYIKKEHYVFLTFAFVNDIEFDKNLESVGWL